MGLAKQVKIKVCSPGLTIPSVLNDNTAKTRPSNFSWWQRFVLTVSRLKEKFENVEEICLEPHYVLNVVFLKN